MTRLSLSFDNGPDPAVTPVVLDMLARHGINATFFVVGKNLELAENRALMARAYREGHWIGNHTYTHSIPLGRLSSQATIRYEIDRTAELIEPFAHPNRFFRPFGEGGILDDRILNTATLNHLQNDRYSCIVWNAVPRDWEDPTGWVETALRQIAGQPETLLVLHDIPTGAMARLGDFIDLAKSKGVTFRQEFPDVCKLTWNGQITQDLGRLVRPM